MQIVYRRAAEAEFYVVAFVASVFADFHSRFTFEQNRLGLSSWLCFMTDAIHKFGDAGHKLGSLKVKQ
jgi:hypothetical protein